MKQQVTETSSVVRAQLLPLSNMQMVLPNTCIAEVISLQTIEPIKKSPDWLLGMTRWRGIQIPVISFEIANGVSADESSKHTRIAVINSLNSKSELPFYGVITQGIPKLVTLEKTDISAIKKPHKTLPIALEQTMINDAAAIIPDQKKIEELLKQQGITVT